MKEKGRNLYHAACVRVRLRHMVLWIAFVVSVCVRAQTNGFVASADSVAAPTDSVPEQVCGAAGQADSMMAHEADTLVLPRQGDGGRSPYRFNAWQLAIPVTLVGVGIIGLESDWLKYQNHEIRNELQENIDSRFTIDDFSQYTPMAATYALNLCGVKGKHGYADLTIILGTAYALMGVTVNTLKVTTLVERPDGSSRNSFPSGHTATAFMGAELLRREYWDVSPWIGVAGYAVAAGTGFFRMYNNRHWLTDVIAGAGVGILSAEAAYWLYPVVSKTFFRKRYLKNTFVSPYVSREGKGVVCSITF